MKVIQVRNVHEALPEALYLLEWAGAERKSRNGPVVYLPEPVTTVYENPRERVLFWPERDANPFFHFYEGLWMLGGREDVASLARFVKRIANYSDNGVTFHGAYGYRWRRHFGKDQLATIALRLRNNPDDRRQVLQIYDTHADAPNQPEKRDIPCNLVVHFQINYGVLDMTVFNRSNDIIWGCYGANAVHFSMLQEVMAAWIGVSVGKYWHVSSNWHAYVDVLEPLRSLAARANQPPDPRTNPYDTVKPFRMVNVPLAEWFDDLDVYLNGGVLCYRDVFFRRVATPMRLAHTLFKERDYTQALKTVETIAATDWQTAARQWLMRRIK